MFLCSEMGFHWLTSKLLIGLMSDLSGSHVHGRHLWFTVLHDASTFPDSLSFHICSFIAIPLFAFWPCKGRDFRELFFKVRKGVLMWFLKVRLLGPDNFQHLYNQWAVLHKLRCLSVLLSVLLFSTPPGSFFFAFLPWTVI